MTECQYRSSSHLKRWTIAQSEIPNPQPSLRLLESHSSDINKKSQSTTLFRGLISFCEVIHLSGVKTAMAPCLCVSVYKWCEREIERKLEP